MARTSRSKNFLRRISIVVLVRSWVYRRLRSRLRRHSVRISRWDREFCWSRLEKLDILVYSPLLFSTYRFLAVLALPLTTVFALVSFVYRRIKDVVTATSTGGTRLGFHIDSFFISECTDV